MAGRIVWAYALVICGYQLLYPAQWLLATALPTGITADNETVYDSPQGNATSITAGDIWEITETAENKTDGDPDGLLFRGGWTSMNQNSKLYLETDEGWLNSGLIANDASIPYRAVGVSTRFGNSSEEWKKLLVKPDAYDHHKQGRVSKVQFNERRDIPFQFHWQLKPKRFFNRTKTP